MKSNILCAVIFILIGNIATAQEDQVNVTNQSSDYFNLTFSMGMTQNIYSKSLTDAAKPGLAYNVDVSLVPIKNVGFFLNYNSADITAKIYDELNFKSSLSRSIALSQFTFGPRLYSNNKNSFIDGGVGFFKVGNDKVAGITFGLGGKVRLTDDYSLSISGRYSASNFFDEPYSNYSIYAGIGINNKNDKPNTSKLNKISIGALAGTYGKSSEGPGNNSFGAELSYSTGKQTAILLSYLYSNSELAYTNNLGDYIIYSKQWQNEISGGVRLYMKGSSIRVFFEGLAGAYYLSTQYPGDRTFNTASYTFSNSYMGITFGGGVEFGLIDNLSGLVKTNVSNYFGEGSYVGLSGGLKYGF